MKNTKHAWIPLSSCWDPKAEQIQQEKFYCGNLPLQMLQDQDEWDQSEAFFIPQQGNGPQPSLRTVLKDQLDEEWQLWHGVRTRVAGQKKDFPGGRLWRACWQPSSWTNTPDILGYSGTNKDQNIKQFKNRWDEDTALAGGLASICSMQLVQQSVGIQTT